ncbi:uncharacterized protein TRIADDRAFT_53363 [Trichoplax adhaerens]|uniref:VWFA domain-containing protein n=1 Tax=Trichoplax adhaerens TaxID=10228 RepID=B3RP11_TRIAD|nr:hypothetical protein TRIADDRAFT_53363 [Trichoplax adhaerens]EDV27551.1 hypothetical protein TRIADDRAFT_53363 [Trichoplax adhaerens]|eukprot:XP_002109385.1 hypothetical protein TRIADDRAFT_53363 [Trichoplax adhaerens]
MKISIDRKSNLSIRILIIIGLVVPYHAVTLNHDVKGWATTLGEEMMVFTEKILSPGKIQRFYDGIDYQQNLTSAVAIVEDLRRQLNASLADIIKFVQSAKSNIESGYSSKQAQSSTSYQLCCNPINLRFNKELNDKINLSSPCITFPVETTQSYIPNSLKLAYRQNFADNLSVKWQYFAGADNIFYQYPTTQRYCKTNYTTETKFKQWYVNAASPSSKRLVLVLDRSGSMSGDRFLKVKEAATAVLDSLGPNDEIGVIAFDDEIRIHGGCKVTTVSPATPQSIIFLKDFINNKIQPEFGSTGYVPALKHAFDMLSTNMTSKAKTKTNLIVFLTDGHPDEPESQILDVIKNRNEALV